MIFHRRVSTYGALVVWGASGFMAQPTLASLFVHLVIIPGALWGTVWLAHHEAAT